MSQPSPESDLDSTSIRLQDHFASLVDPRRRKVTYPLVNVVTIAVCAVICGADDFVAIATWGRLKRDWLETILDLEAGIPSHDRFNAIFQALDTNGDGQITLAEMEEKALERFARLDTNGDAFAVTLAQALDAGQELEMGLAISFGFQDPTEKAVCGDAFSQFSTLDVNGTRVSSCAGGDDDNQRAGSGSSSERRNGSRLRGDRDLR